MKALLSKIDKLERRMRSLNKQYLFELAENKERFAELAHRYETDDQVVCVIYKLYEE